MPSSSVRRAHRRVLPGAGCDAGARHLRPSVRCSMIPPRCAKWDAGPAPWARGARGAHRRPHPRRGSADVREHHRAAGHHRDAARRAQRRGGFPRSSLFFGPAVLREAFHGTRGGAGAHLPGGPRGVVVRVPVLPPAEGARASPHHAAGPPLLGRGDRRVRRRAPAQPQDRATQYLFLRAVRKLTRRFDPAILDTEDARMKGALEKVSRIEELLAPAGARESRCPPRRSWQTCWRSIVGRLRAALPAHARGDGHHHRPGAPPGRMDRISAPRSPARSQSSRTRTGCRTARATRS